MTYAAFDPAKPDASSQNITQFAQSARDNAKAIRDACILGGGFPGWALAISGGTAEQPTTFVYSKSSERVRATLTWGTVGGEAGNPTSTLFEYSSNSGSSYDPIGTKTNTFDGSGNLTAVAWS